MGKQVESELGILLCVLLHGEAVSFDLASIFVSSPHAGQQVFFFEEQFLDFVSGLKLILALQAGNVRICLLKFLVQSCKRYCRPSVLLPRA